MSHYSNCKGTEYQIHIFLSLVLPLALIILLIKYFFLPMFKRDDFFAAKGELKKISIDTPLLNRLGMNTEDYYYDADFLYQKRKEDILNKIALGQIIQVRPTGTKIGNRCVWQVRYLTGASRTEKTVSILNNYSLFNQDFAGFLSAVRVANPEAEVEKMAIWRI